MIALFFKTFIPEGKEARKEVSPISMGGAMGHGIVVNHRF